MGRQHLHFGQYRPCGRKRRRWMLAAGSSRFVRTFLPSKLADVHSPDRDSVIQSWHVFLGYQIVNIFAFFFNCYGRILPTMGKLAFWTSLLSFFIILVAVPSKAPTHQEAKFVFANFVNNTGWKQNGIGRASLATRIYPPS